MGRTGPAVTPAASFDVIAGGNSIMQGEKSTLPLFKLTCMSASRSIPALIDFFREK
jgi:hypothetical protein